MVHIYEVINLTLQDYCIIIISISIIMGALSKRFKVERQNWSTSNAWHEPYREYGTVWSFSLLEVRDKQIDGIQCGGHFRREVKW